MTQSYTATIIEHMETRTGALDGADAPDHEESAIAACEILDILQATFADTSMESEIEEMLWQFVNVFHRKGVNLEQRLDGQIQKLQTLQAEQDGSEVKSVELEAALDESHQTEARLETIQAMREAAAQRFSFITGSAWLPKSGTRTKWGGMTASMIDAKDFTRARQMQKAAHFVPNGKSIAIAPGKSTDHQKIWDMLDRVQQKIVAENKPMILLHGGGDGAELIAARWAEARKVQQVVFRPDWKKHGKAAPFKRNDALIDAQPAGLLVFAHDNEHGIQQQLVRNATQAGIKVKIL